VPEMRTQADALAGDLAELLRVRKDIDAAIAVNGKVKLHYREKYFRWSWLGDTKHFIDKVERAG